MRQSITIQVAAACAVCIALCTAADAQPGRGAFGPPPQQVGNQFIVLGTASGPNSEAQRAQPANALVVDGQVWLVDAGDGAVAQLARAGQRLAAVRGVFLSHLHFDHTGGMFAVLGLRMQLEQRGTLRVFGPPGTAALIDGLLAAAAPAMRAGYGIPEQGWTADIDVVELGDGATLSLDGFEVRVAENSHFSLPEGHPGPAEGVSLSFRFELADRSIVYTGDTGPSEAVVELARGADLLVSEMVDADAALAAMGFGGGRGANPAADAAPLTGLPWHMHAHHLTPHEVGELAGAAGVGRVVVTHFAPNPTGPEQARAYLESIRENYAGDAELASDLASY